MNSTVKKILALVAGFIVGNVINMGIIMISGSIIPPPDGADLTTTEGLKASIHLLQPIHFIFPFLAHALGTFSGALLTAKIATNHKLKFAMAIGIVSLLGGIYATTIFPAPNWFIVVDLIGAYIPTAYLAGKLSDKKKVNQT
jgi:hypothetical protein